MTGGFGLECAVVATCLALHLGGTMIVNWTRRMIRRRTDDLRATAKLLNRHYDAAERFLSDPEAPEALKDLVVKLGLIAADQEMASAFVDFLCVSASSQSDDGSRHVHAAIRELRNSNEELADEFAIALLAGVAAAFLRWPGTSEFYGDMVTEHFPDTRRGTEFAAGVARFVQHARDRDDTSVLTFGGGPAAAAT